MSQLATIDMQAGIAYPHVAHLLPSQLPGATAVEMYTPAAVLLARWGA